MREIKFRAYVEDSFLSNPAIGGYDQYSKTVEVNGIFFSDGKVEHIVDDDGEEYSYEDKSLHSLMQFTGMKDKNGKEIYFGDIYEGFIRTIETEYGDGGIGELGFPENIYVAHQEVREEFEKGVIEDWDDVLTLEYHDAVEVIGNIHENPELLQ